MKKIGMNPVSGFFNVDINTKAGLYGAFVIIQQGYYAFQLI